MSLHEQLVVDSRLEAIFKVQQWLKDLYASLDAELGWVRAYGDRLNIAVTEGFTNAVRHAHAHLPPETPIEIEVSLEGNRIDICIWDRGQPFDPDKLCDLEPGCLSLVGGYGWFLLRRLTDKVTYNRYNNQNCLAITQYRS
jgi:serine/threonine-protein kinase RsbW